jgi:hypothetical protein
MRSGGAGAAVAQATVVPGIPRGAALLSYV